MNEDVFAALEQSSAILRRLQSNLEQDADEIRYGLGGELLEEYQRCVHEVQNSVDGMRKLVSVLLG